jgi:hypothetical protein
MKKYRKPLDRIIHYKAVFGSEEGKKVLYDLMKAHHVMSPVMVKGDPYDTAFMEGERNVVLRIISLLKLDPEKILESIQRGEAYDNIYNEE